MNKHLIILGVTILLIYIGLSGCNEQSDDELVDSGVITDETQSIQILSYDLKNYRKLTYDWHYDYTNLAGKKVEHDGSKYVYVPEDFKDSDIYDYNKRREICLNIIEPTLTEDNIRWLSDYWSYYFDTWTWNNLRMELSNFRSEIGYWVVSGTAKNIGDAFLDKPKIIVNFYNSADAWLAKETYRTYDIASGYSWDFEVTYSGKYKNDVTRVDFDFEF
jgi:hypothetical protein